MSKQTKIYISKALDEAMGVLQTDAFSSVTYRINVIGDRYNEIMRREKIETLFTEDELWLIKDSMNGTISEPACAIENVWFGVEDSIDLDRLDEKWSVEKAPFMKKLKSLSFAQEVALVEHVEQFWRKC